MTKAENHERQRKIASGLPSLAPMAEEITNNNLCFKDLMEIAIDDDDIDIDQVKHDLTTAKWFTPEAAYWWALVIGDEDEMYEIVADNDYWRYKWIWHFHE